jgi:Tol biopolymer transport system component
LDPCENFNNNGQKQLRIVFVANWDGDSEIYTIRADGSGISQLTNNDTPDKYPVWSPDGSKIVSQDLISNKINVMNADGSEKHVLLANVKFTEMMPGVSWSPDGQKIAFSGRTEESGLDLFIVNLTNESLEQVLKSDGFYGFYDPSWSPDGQFLSVNRVFHSSIGEVSTAYLLQLNNLGSWKLDQQQKFLMDWAFEWDPLGEGVLIEAYELDSVAKYFIFTPEKNLYRNLPVHGQPYISPDGQKFAYIHTPGEDSILHIIQRDGTNNRDLWAGYGIGQLSWAPDSQHIAFYADIYHKNVFDLYNLDICSGIFRVVENVDIFGGGPSWQP